MSKFVDTKFLDFVLYEVLDLKSLFARKRYEDHDEESTRMFLQSVKQLADKSMYPYFRDMDRQPAIFDHGQIKTHECLGDYIKQSGELGLISAIFDYDHGGMQAPLMVHTAATYIQETANNHMPGYLGLTLGAAELIIHFAEAKYKELYVPKMLTGEWMGTMCLTEPEAGSSLSDLTTEAVPQDDGTYKISGQKIFISGGDHEHSSNFVHLLLARIPGGPAGTKGISLFIVPKMRIKEDGSLEPNDVTTVGDFQKMGQKGYCTTHLMFGEKDDCRGYLVGQEHKGLKYMFLMMNGARIAVGRGAAAITEAAYHAAHRYSNERVQGRKISSTGKKDVNQQPCLIVEHADVKRMLLLQKSISEASHLLVQLTAKYADLHYTSTDNDEKMRAHQMLELLTPLCKTYPSEMGQYAVNNGLQILGGYGFCEEYVLQQYLRDIRISAIYEGTTGIQSLDLLVRKVPMNGGEALKTLGGQIMESITSAMAHEDLQASAKKLGSKLVKIQEVLAHLGQYAAMGNYERYAADANLFMEMTGHIVAAWCLLGSALKAKELAVAGSGSYDDAFYKDRLAVLRYYCKYELSKVDYLASSLQDEDDITITSNMTMAL